MSARQLFLMLLLVCVWGFNYVVIRVGLYGMPPIFLAFARFLLTAFPAIFFIKRPAIPFRQVVFYGLIIFTLQFICFFIGMDLGVPPGLAAIIMQVQVFFSLILAVIFFSEKFTIVQVVGALISFLGIIYTGVSIGGSLSLSGFFFVIAGALCWGGGSAFSKSIGKVNTISLVVWASMVAWPILLVLSLCIEGPERIMSCFANSSITTLGAVLYLAYFATIFGYGLWSWLLQHQPLSVIAPFSLLIPIVAMLSSILLLHEPLQSWKIIGSLLVMGGLSINFFGSRLKKPETRPVIDASSSELEG